MVAPIALVLAAAGAVLGRTIVAVNRKRNGAVLVVLICLLPFAAGFERLAPEANAPLVEGSTWYEIDIHPRAYWQLFASSLIQQIHLRVLNHIKAGVEASAG